MNGVIRVLLVEDDQVDRMAFQRAAARWAGPALQVLEAETGVHGLALAQAGQVDCIVLDYQLPDMNGLEFLDRLAAGAQAGAAPVMMLTGADSATVAAEAMRRGARDYLVKDSDGQYLVRLPEAIARMLREQRLVEEKQRAEAALRHSEDELRRLANHQDKIKEHERKRIAQEIHDELGGLLTGIKAYVSVVSERARQSGAVPDPLLAETAALAQSAIDTVRRVITDLRPSVLDQLGVWAALDWYAEQVQQRTGLQCSCHIDAPLLALELDPERSTMLFRVAQEALTNVARHAQATEASVEVRRDGAGLCLTVRDNGRGIDTEGLLSRDSWGILGMHERSRRFGGDLTIKGGAGQGTTLQLRLPRLDDDDN